ncbi:1,2-dihydroxy-3-keto-5-methylthiopentene dioxygenase [Ketobacter alkanivorans]|uniref:Acireductone dioxygenase n=1 Tax=Ketobacter alkanivorans TaxID=1917421 RepID=A0A2K9LKD6_9GAMM|nr:cupin [Ketobacter alkanivorans]AUM11224.1 cupin [Ketobacter alkanivorans]MCP5015901.1 cupin [Ketobacter sp.]
MSTLYVYNDKDAGQADLTTEDQNEIARILGRKGIQFEQWEANFPITADSTADDILNAYADSIEKLQQEGGYQTADVINMTPNHPDKIALRNKFLNEHTHSEDEVRFFVKGDGVFYLHLDDGVYAVRCCKNDLISVPANTRHWFDMGDSPNFTAVRLFTNPDGWVANFTGEKIADEFPRYEALAK